MVVVGCGVRDGGGVSEGYDGVSGWLVVLWWWLC